MKDSTEENNYHVSSAGTTNLEKTAMPVPGSVGVQGQNATQGESRACCEENLLLIVRISLTNQVWFTG